MMSHRSKGILASLRGGLLLCLVMFMANGTSAKASDFVSQVDLQPLEELAVHTEGRLNSFGSHANALMQEVTGSKRIDGRTPLYTYLDMLFRPSAYEDADVIYVKNKLVRKMMVEALRKSPDSMSRIPDFEARMADFQKIGLTSPTILADPALIELMGRLKSDLIRTNKDVASMEIASRVMNPSFLLGQMKVIPPPGDSLDRPWRSISRVMLVPSEDDEMSLTPQPTLEGLDRETQDRIANAWHALFTSWTTGDSVGVNAAIEQLSVVIPTVNPELYPSTSRLSWESWYFRNHQLTRIWLVYMLSLILLLLGLVYRWRWARWGGMTVFLVALALQTFAVGLRWYISGRWPNSNMYEAVTTAAWFGSVGAVVLEVFVRRTGMKSIFALSAATASMVALMAAYYLPAYMNPNISNMMPVLNDIWLYIHTNAIIFSYCLIFMAAVSGGLYIVNRLFGGAPAYAKAGGAASVLLATGAGASESSPGGGAPVRRARLGEVLDGVSMLLMELSFVLLWAGLVMGAIWADHSWGRPWGWDPKEVFALETFIVFALLIHVRMKVHDKGLWTAWLCVLGAAVMLFNWIVINFVITGLHSYA